MKNNNYTIDILNLKHLLLLNDKISPTKKHTKALHILKKVTLYSVNKRIVSPYLPILKRFNQLLQLNELSHIFQNKPEDSQRIFAIIILYAEGNLPLPNALQNIRAPYTQQCLICIEPLKLNTTSCPGNQCYAIFCIDCLEQWLAVSPCCPSCRSSNNPVQNNTRENIIRPSRTHWTNSSGGFGY